MKPLGRRVLIQPDEQKDGLIKIPERYRPKYPLAGTILAVGPEVQTVKPGQKVLFGKHAYVESPHGLLLWERDLMAVMEEG